MTLADLKHQQQLLADGTIVADWAAGHSSFGAKFVRFAEGHLGVWKADYAKYNTLRHEIAASRVDEHLGLFLVPATVKKDFRGTPGTVQWVVGPLNNKRFAEMLDELGFLDYLIDNRDRSRNNVLQTENGAMVAIDHGLSFGELGNWRSDKAFENFEENVKSLAYIMKSRKNLEAQIAQNPNASVDARRSIVTLKNEESKLQTKIQIFSPERSVILKLKNTTREQWEEVLGDSITEHELTALIARQERLVQSFESAETQIGKDLLYRQGAYSSITGVIIKDSATPQPAQNLQKMKNRRAFGDF